jgi:hypothetical protein
MDDREQRIREKAFQLWLEEGQPEGQQERHWALASELVAIEHSQIDTTIPLAEIHAGEPVEALENAGEFPTLTDQGEMEIPHSTEEAAPEAERTLEAPALAAEPPLAETLADMPPAWEEGHAVATEAVEPTPAEPAKSGSIWESLGLGWGSKSS